MTEQMAIEKLNMLDEALNFQRHDADECSCALQMAIQVLEEIQQYRAIGTVEGYKRAIDVSKENYRLYLEYKAKVQAHEAIGTIEELQALKEKSVPREIAEHNFQDEPHHYLCPNCRNIVNYGQKYCEECGQALKD